VAIFDTSTITLTGEVPSAAAVARLSSLAVANSQTPAVVVNNLTINPAVPISVGVRVIELNSVRFPTASANVLPAHAKELDRVANVMKALPNVSVLVIGHADQRGTDTNNLATSTARAQAVLNYLIYVGISPSRLTSQGVGATDLLTAQTDDVALALNRRTEFIFYGLLIG
jgi:OOP family OmpA-OmpF porin